jgi:hypothetical protein
VRSALLCLLALPLFAQLPDPKLTPGATLKVGTDQICKPGYSKKARAVSTSSKRYVFKLYGLTYTPKSYETDHLIPLELAGANTANNLWPEPYAGEMNAHVKDKLENKLHALVCSGKLDLKTAQTAIADDWIKAYFKYAQ